MSRSNRTNPAGFLRLFVVLNLVSASALAGLQVLDEQSLPEACADYDLVRGDPRSANFIFMDGLKTLEKSDADCVAEIIRSNTYEGTASVHVRTKESLLLNDFLGRLCYSFLCLGSPSDLNMLKKIDLRCGNSSLPKGGMQYCTESISARIPHPGPHVFLFGTVTVPQGPEIALLSKKKEHEAQRYYQQARIRNAAM